MTYLRNFVFTINNYKEDALDLIKDHPKLRYLVAGREVGETGTPHLQGYAELTHSVRFTTIKKLLPTAHFEPRVATAKQAADYCKKDGDIFIEVGNISHQGRANCLVAACEMIMNGERNREVAVSHPTAYVRYHRGMNALRYAITPPRDIQPEVYVIHGPTGVGKSRLARNMLEDCYVWEPQQEKWFDGYEGQPDVLFEEFRGQLPFGMLLSLTDRYSCKVQTKGGMAQFVATKIIFTSPSHPRDWYELTNSEDKWNQFSRRCPPENIIHLKTPGDIQNYFLK